MKPSRPSWSDCAPKLLLASRKSARNALPAKQPRPSAWQRNDAPRKNAKPPLAEETEAKAAAERRELELRLAAERRSARSWKHGSAPSKLSVMHSGAPKKPAAAERQRQADEQARIEREAAAREADKAHKKAINNEAPGGPDRRRHARGVRQAGDHADRSAQVPHITINY
ncbi:hypothetical protein ACPA9J_15675 [Pseudomonas aeruginosa]